MSIQKIQIKGYQSHHDTVLEPGNLTVIVGQSSSGKSAVVRAMKAMTSNQSGKSFITHGEQTAQISFTTDKGTVVLTKGKPEDSYVILENGGQPKKFTKNGTGVPEAVTDFLGIAPKDAINFAGQFDMPYLLRTPAGEVARVLGELTNVSSIFEASREALRLKNSYAATLKTREQDLAAVSRNAERFENLEVRDMYLTNAEQYHRIAVGHQKDISRLDDLVTVLKIASARVKAAADTTASPLPDMNTVQFAYDELQGLDHTTAALQAASAKKKSAEASVAALTAQIDTLDTEYENILHEAGTCPTCGADTKEHSHA